MLKVDTPLMKKVSSSGACSFDCTSDRIAWQRQQQPPLEAGELQHVVELYAFVCSLYTDGGRFIFYENEEQKKCETMLLAPVWSQNSSTSVANDCCSTEIFYTSMSQPRRARSLQCLPLCWVGGGVGQIYSSVLSRHLAPRPNGAFWLLKIRKKHPDSNSSSRIRILGLSDAQRTQDSHREATMLTLRRRR